MGITKLKRQAILGQFLLGTDMLAQGIADNVGVSPGYARTNTPYGLILSGRSDRVYYHPDANPGVIYRAAGLVVYRWSNFSSWTLNANAQAVNGLTVDGLINPSSPSGGGLMQFTRSSLGWEQMGVVPGIAPYKVTCHLFSNLVVELPQFAGYNAGGSNEGGYIDSIYTNIHDSHGDNLVNAGSIGVNTPFWPYRTPYQQNQTVYDFTFVRPDLTFDLGVWINWNRPNGRWNLKKMEMIIQF